LANVDVVEGAEGSEADVRVMSNKGSDVVDAEGCGWIPEDEG
jgi:hypothetical protein